MYHVRQGKKVIKLDGSEEYFAKCHTCGKEISFDGDEIIELSKDTGLYGASWYCADCTEERQLVKPEQ